MSFRALMLPVMLAAIPIYAVLAWVRPQLLYKNCFGKIRSPGQLAVEAWAHDYWTYVFLR